MNKLLVGVGVGDIPLVGLSVLGAPRSRKIDRRGLYFLEGLMGVDDLVAQKILQSKSEPSTSADVLTAETLINGFKKMKEMMSKPQPIYKYIVLGERFKNEIEASIEPKYLSGPFDKLCGMTLVPTKKIKFRDTFMFETFEEAEAFIKGLERQSAFN